MNEVLIVANFIFAISVIGVGLFFRSYLADKAKNLATKEDIAHITKLTEQTKAEVHRHSLIKEKWWELKKEIYFDLIANLDRISEFARKSVINVDKINKSKNDAEFPKLKEQTDLLLKEFSNCLSMFKKSRAFSALILDHKMIISLNKYADDLASLIPDGFEQIPTLLKMDAITLARYEEIVAHAKSD